MSEIKTGISVYDINASLIKNAPPLKWEGLHNAKSLINNFHKEHKNRYYMALCHNLRYFTVYDTKPNDCKVIDLATSFATEVVNCTKLLGNILDVQISENHNSIEIWVRRNNKRGAECIVLLPYDKGMVKVGEKQ